MKKFFISSILCCLISLCHSQTITAPSFDWADTLSGGEASYVSTDQSGNVYVAGVFSGVRDFDPGAGTFTLSGATNSLNIYILKLNPQKNFLWAKKYSIPQSISTSFWISGNTILLSGYFSGFVDFDPGPSNFILSSTLAPTSFIVKLDTSGNFIWAKNFKSKSDNYPWKIKCDDSGNIYTLGVFSDSTDFDPGVGVYNLSTEIQKAYLVKLNAAGNFVFASEVGLSGWISSSDFDVDVNGNVYHTGWFTGSVDGNASSQVDTVKTVGVYDTYISKINSNGSMAWIRILTDSFWVKGHTIRTDGDGNIYSAGIFYQDMDIDPGSAISVVTPTTQVAVYFVKFDSQGNLLTGKHFNGGYSTYLHLERGLFGTMLLAGNYDNIIGIGPGNANFVSTGMSDLFVAKLDGAGNSLWARFWGGPQDDRLYGISTDGSLAIYTVGSFKDTIDMDPGPITNNFFANGSAHFIHKMMECCTEISEVNSDDNVVLVFPNPTSGNLTIENKTEDVIVVSLIDISGRALITQQCNDAKELLDVSGLSNGVYFIEAISKGHKTRVYKIVKQ